MSSDPTKISIDQSSIINLKAELQRKQEEFRLKRASKSYDRLESEYETHKTQSTWGKKKKELEEKPEKKSDEKVESQMETEENIFEKSRKMLESKAKYYEDIVAGKKVSEEGDEEIFLVDFDIKKSEATSQQSEETKGFRLKNELSEEEYNERLKQKWQKDAEANLEKSSVHYQDIRFDEIRNTGVGSYQFSRDQTEREKQMAFFREIEKEIEASKIYSELYKLKREKALLERLSKVKQRRLLKHGFTVDEIKNSNKFDAEIQEVEKEIEELEELSKNPQLLKIKQAESQPEPDFEMYKPKGKKLFEREWDKPKLKEQKWTKHVEKLRKERIKMFAPPTSYNQTGKSKQKGKRKNYQPAESNRTQSYAQTEQVNLDDIKLPDDI